VLCGRSAGEPHLASVRDDFVGSRRNLGMREFFLGTHLLDHLDELPERVESLFGDRIAVPITTFPFAEADAALDLLQSGTTVGKILLTVGT
jgi:NADPH:quinone reductase-like Zn-dependent oxidoreductase